MDFPEIKCKSLADQAYEYLSASIIEGKIKAGENLVEKDLCQKFGISRSPLRECFRILEADGLIAINPRRGAYARKLLRKDVEDIFIVRTKLESLAAKLAVPNITENEIGTFNDLIIKMDEAVAKGNTKSFIELNDAFHNIFIEASNNEILKNNLKNPGKGIWRRVSILYFHSPLALDLSSNKHKEIVEAFIKKDSISVERLVEEHLERAQNHLLSSLPF